MTEVSGTLYTCSVQETSHCAECSSNTTCSTCKVGYFGEISDQQCSAGCRNHECRKENGECSSASCLSGYYGDFCCEYGKYSNCSLSCPSHCKKCTSEFSCSECVIGYYGETCSLPCSDGCLKEYGCLKENGHCRYSLCLYGHYGESCCPYGTYGNCSETCPNNCKRCTSSLQCTECKTEMVNAEIKGVYLGTTERFVAV